MFNRATVKMSLCAQTCVLRSQAIDISKQMNDDGNIADGTQLANTIQKQLQHTLKGHNIALAIPDAWIDYQSLSLAQCDARHQPYLIQQQCQTTPCYDYRVIGTTAHVWQLALTQYQAYQQLCQALGAKLQSIEPYSQRLQQAAPQHLKQPYAMIGHFAETQLYVVQNSTVVFSHSILDDNIDSALTLFEQSHQQSISTIVTNHTITCNKTILPFCSQLIEEQLCKRLT